LKANKAIFRSLFLNESSDAVQKNPWLKETPYDVRDEGMNDFLKALKTCYAKGEQFDIKFRSKKDGESSIAVLKKHWKKNQWFRTFFKAAGCETLIRSSEVLPDVLHADSRMVQTRDGKYYLCLVKPLEVRGENQAPKTRVLSLDPGVRTFLTGYDTSGFIYEWGKQDMQRLKRLGHAVDRVQSKWGSVNHKKRYKLQRVARRIREKIRHLVEDLHRKSIKWMVENFTTIVLPHFGVCQMVQKGASRKLRKSTVREMLTWSHGRFRTLLLGKIREYPWCQVVICTEEYTSKTCGKCGCVHSNLGGSKLVV